METEELESLLDGAEETDRLEFKQAMDWNRNTLVKDILAMANVQDGGRIVIGVIDETFQREGMTEKQIETYKIDDMRDQIAPFADPLVEFRVRIAKDREGLMYVIIDVSPFDEFPVICRRDGSDVQCGTVYFRSRAQKPQSARVSNSSDMREIIDRSVIRSMRAKTRLGFTVSQDAEYDFDAELGGL
jgi:predicted HTH transcriptional regulator